MVKAADAGASINAKLQRDISKNQGARVVAANKRRASGAHDPEDNNREENVAFEDHRLRAVAWLNSVIDNAPIDNELATASLQATQAELIELNAGSTQLWTLAEKIEEAINALHKRTAASIEGRSDTDKHIAFVSDFYAADLECTGSACGLQLIQKELGMKLTLVERLAEWAESEGIIKQDYATFEEQYFKITPQGREWFTESIGVTSVANTGPWWLRRDSSNHKWKKLADRTTYDRDKELAIEQAANSQPVSLLFIDFDNLKALNTAHTNARADESLGRTIDIIDSCIQGKGRAYLHGNGDEFAVLLPNSSPEEALATAERICQTCRATSLDGLPNPTVSIGVATYPNHASSAARLEECAGEAELSSKAAGKDRASLWIPDEGVGS